MPYIFETQLHNGYLLLTVSGALESAEDILAYSKAIVDCAQESGCKRVLLDERTAPVKADQHEWMLYADQWVSDRSGRIGLRTAAVYSPADARNYHWIETILQNRSIIYKIFDAMDEAEKWLLS